jgi:hypothetical protein
VESCLFMHDPTNTLIVVHADDVLFATPGGSAEWLYQLFESELKLKRGAIISADAWTPYLGRLYRRTARGFEVKIPEKFYQTVFDLFGLQCGTGGKKQAVVTPFPTKLEADAGAQPLPQEAMRVYRALAGKVMWAGNERPELLYPVKELCRHFGSASQSDMAAAKRLARYLLGTFEKSLVLEVDAAFEYLPQEADHTGELDIQGVSDATWASTSDCRSTSGGTVWVEGFLLHAWSKTQPTVSQSSCEAELLAANLTAREGLFVKSIIEEIGIRPELHLFTDSASALKVTARRGAGRMRHLHVKELWIQEAVRDHRLKVFYVPGQANIADVLTKPLPRERFEHLTDILGVRGPSSLARTRGGHGKQGDDHMVGGIWSEEGQITVSGEELQCEGVVAPSLPLGLSLTRLLQMVVVLTLLMVWLVYRMCKWCFTGQRKLVNRTVATQSPTTYTACAGSQHPRFKVLGREAEGAWVD